MLYALYIVCRCRYNKTNERFLDSDVGLELANCSYSMLEVRLYSNISLDELEFISACGNSERVLTSCS